MDLIQLLAMQSWPANAAYCVQTQSGNILAGDGALDGASPSELRNLQDTGLTCKPAYDYSTAIVTFAMWRTARDKFLNTPKVLLKNILGQHVDSWPAGATYAVQDKTGVVWFLDAIADGCEVCCNPRGVWNTLARGVAHHEILDVADDCGCAKVSLREWTTARARTLNLAKAAAH